MVDRAVLDSEGRAVTGDDLNLLEKLGEDIRESVSKWEPLETSGAHGVLFLSL